VCHCRPLFVVVHVPGACQLLSHWGSRPHRSTGIGHHSANAKQHLELHITDELRFSAGRRLHAVELVRNGRLSELVSASTGKLAGVSDTAPVPVHLHKALDGLAENPALPDDLIRRLLAYRRGLGQVAKRPDLSEDMIAEILATGDRWLAHSLALNRGLAHSFRTQLAEHRDPSVRAAVVVGGGKLPRGVFERLIGDVDFRVREYLAQGDDVPADLRSRLAADPDPRIRETLAQWWPQAPEEVRRILLTDSVPEVRAAACARYFRRSPHPVPPPDLLPALLADPVTRVGAVRHMKLDPDTARQLVGDRDFRVRREVAGHPALSADLRDVLAEDPSAAVQVHIFARQDTPEPMRAAIYSAIEQGARGLFEHPADISIDDTAWEQEYEDFLARAELRNLHLPWVAADPLPHIDSPYACFRASAAACDRLPPAVVARLLDDEESRVRTTMARHAPDLVDVETAERIDRDFQPAKKTRWRPADDFTFPPQTLRRFATDPDPRMRCLAPRDPDLPAELAERLAADPVVSVRHSVATHPSLPTGVLLELLADQSESVACVAASSPYLPVQQMERLLILADL